MEGEVTTEAGAGLKALGTRKRQQPPETGKGGKQILQLLGDQAPSAARMRTIFGLSTSVSI